MYNSNIEDAFSLDAKRNQEKDIGYGDGESIATAEIAELQKRVKRKHPLAQFRIVGCAVLGDWSYKTVAIKLSPINLCFDARVDCFIGLRGRDTHYVVASVSTARTREIPYEDRELFNIDYCDKEFTSITKSLSRAVKVVNNTVSWTPTLTVKKAFDYYAEYFQAGLDRAQKKLNDLKRGVFSTINGAKTNEALLEYCLAGMENRPVSGEISNLITDSVEKYLVSKKDLGESVSVCDGLQMLALCKLADSERIYYHRIDYKPYGAPPAVLPSIFCGVGDINELPEEVLGKLFTMQSIGEDNMEVISYSRCVALDGVGATVKNQIDNARKTTNIPFASEIMCVYVAPETLEQLYKSEAALSCS